MEFTNEITVIDDLNVGRINGNPLDSYVRIDRPNEITSKIIFKQAEIIGDVIISKKAKQNVNLRELNETSGKIFSENIISGLKNFTGSVEVKNLQVKKKINGIDANEYVKRYNMETFKDLGRNKFKFFKLKKQGQSGNRRGGCLSSIDGYLLFITE